MSTNSKEYRKLWLGRTGNKERARKYQLKQRSKLGSKEKACAYSRQYRLEHPKETQAYNKRWRENNPNYTREYRKLHTEQENQKINRWRVKNRQKNLAHQVIHGRVHRGSLVKPSHCPRCKKRTAKHLMHAHHFIGYENPLVFKWLCYKCHQQEHRLERRKL